MIKIVKGFVASLLMMSVITGCARGGGSDPITFDEPVQEVYLEEAEYIEDIEELVLMLEKNHKNVYFEVSEDVFHQEANKFKNECNGMSISEFNAGILNLLALVGDTHTQAFNYENFNYNPIIVTVLEEGIFITETSETQKDILGSKIISVNDIDIEEVKQSLYNSIPSNNETYQLNALPHYIICEDILRHDGIIQNHTIYGLELEDGTKRKLEVSGCSREDMNNIEWISLKKDKSEDSEDGKSKNYFITENLEENCVYLQYNSCSEDSNYKIKELITDLERAIDKENVTLVVDVRYNGGGNSRVFEPVIKAISKSSVNEEGRLFLLIGRKTFSSAIHNTITFLEDTNVITVGEPTGGEANHFGEVKSFQLPHSRIKVSYSSKYFELSKTFPGSIEPMYEVDYTYEAYVENTDPAYDKILELKNK